MWLLNYNQLSRGSSYGKVVLRTIQWRSSSDINPLHAATPKAWPQIHLAPVNTEGEKERESLSPSFFFSLALSTRIIYSPLLLWPLSFSHETYFTSPRGLPDPKLEKKGHTPCRRFTPRRVHVYIVIYGHCVIAKSVSIFELFHARQSPTY